MRRLALVAALLAAGCGPARMGQPYFPNLAMEWDYVQHLGDKLTLGADAADATVAVTVKNPVTGQAQAVPLAGAKGEVTLDATTLPGYDASAAVQAFDVAQEVRWQGATSTWSRGFLLVADREAILLPPAPSEFGTQVDPMAPPVSVPQHWRSTDSADGPEAYVQHLVATWPIPSPTISSAPVARGEITSNTPSLAFLPAEAKMVRYEVRAAFPKYVIPEGADGKPAVMAPTTLELTLSRTDPAALVSLKVY